MAHGIKTRKRALALVEEGLTTTEAAAAVGASQASVSRWCARAGGRPGRSRRASRSTSPIMGP